jgi:hypothetical protein
MKSINHFILLCLLSTAVVFTSCDDEPEVSNISRVTYFPTFEYEGGDFALVACNSSFELPEVKATENGVELPVNTTVEGALTGASTFDIGVPDKYVITSSATNQDGFDGLVVRTVWVACNGDLVNSIEGLYTATVVRNGVSSPQYTNLRYVLITKIDDDTYEISDAIGGYYDIGRAYGDAYRAAGMTITANSIPGNDFSFGGPIGVGAFGGSLEMTSFSVDPGTGTIHFTSSWDAGFDFDVTLTQVQL